MDIILLGSPRSGTTWLAKIFDSHEEVLYRHEPDIQLRNHAIPFMPDPEEIPVLIEETSDYLLKLKNVRTIKAAGSLPAFPKLYRSRFSEVTRSNLVKMTRLAEFLLAKFGTSATFQIPDFIQANEDSPARFVMKSVSSLGRARLFASALPEARIIHIVRHPCAVVASRLRGKRLNLMDDDAFLDTQVKVSRSTGHRLTLGMLKAMTHEQQLATFWMLQNEKVMTEMQGNPNYRLVVYEELCESTTELCKELFAFSGLYWSSQTENFIDSLTRQEPGGERYYQIVRNPIQSAYKWKDELTAQQISDIKDAVYDSLPGKLYFGH